MRFLKNKATIVLYSAGPDSTFLVEYLLKKNYHNLILLLINYQQRNDVMNDIKIAQNFAQSHILKIIIIKCPKDIKGNFQAYARKFRYDEANKLAKKFNTNQIVTGHQKNDYWETVQLQKIRKIKCDYYGIKRNIKYEDCFVFRPIIKFSKSQILKYLQKNNIDYAIDKSNNTNKYLRNKIRNSKNNYLNNNEKIIIELKNSLKKIIFQYKLKILNNLIINNEITINKLNKYNLEIQKYVLLKWLVKNNIEITNNKLNNILFFIEKNYLNSNKEFVLNNNKNLLIKNRNLKIITKK